MFALLRHFESLRYGDWAPPGDLVEPWKGLRSEVDSSFTGCSPEDRGCFVSGIFGPNGRLAGAEKDCWADGLCQNPPHPVWVSGPE